MQDMRDPLPLSALTLAARNHDPGLAERMAVEFFLLIETI
jgi:hypothetical protein